MLSLRVPEFGLLFERVLRILFRLSPGYRRHRPEATLLYQLVAENYPWFRDRRTAEGRPLPRYVEDEFEAYLKCGLLEHGFLRVKCDACQAEALARDGRRGTISRLVLSPTGSNNPRRHGRARIRLARAEVQTLTPPCQPRSEVSQARRELGTNFFVDLRGPLQVGSVVRRFDISLRALDKFC